MKLSISLDLHPDQTMEEIFTQWMEDYEATGDGYLEIIKDQDIVVGFEHTPAYLMRRHKDEIRDVQVRGHKSDGLRRLEHRQFKRGTASI
ncbi:hypothetical protein SAMN05444392_11550 [Seinonella peptonophila]|uniref:Uncharacterized protein n=1 Tax=Seinonella peptonophila TaxID=112248 RepID=A0A1M5AR40_9BACL|nr:hypothetical protein [Seinonella peptonophila]SHF32626.1 hypothetical protein SAMN05444392_11550 [Seinonella peptonophila]